MNNMRDKIEIPLACLSMANLFFMPAWVEISLADFNLAPNMDIRLYSLAAIIETLTLGAGLYLCYFLLSRWSVRPWILRFLFLLSPVLVIPALYTLDQMLVDLGLAISFSTRVLAYLILALVAIVAFCCYFRKGTLKAAGRFGKVCLLLAAPLLVVSGYAFGRGLFFPYSLADRVPLESFSGLDQPRRVVLLIFDELDYKWAVENRPGSVPMPVFDRFRAVSWEAVVAYPPSNRTFCSILSFFSGKIIGEIRFNDPFNLDMLIEETRTWLPANNPDNLIGRLKEKGIPSGIVGFYIPYGRILGSQLTMCRWENCRAFFRLPGIPAWMFPIIKSYPFALRLSFFHAFDRLIFGAREAIGKKDIGFLLIHLPVPHPPSQYDPQTGRRSHLIRDKNPVSSYQNNLGRMDQVLESLLESLDALGAAGNTVIILTSDHWFRADPSPGFRVPFLVHFPGQANKVLFNDSFNTVTLYNLIPEIFSGALANGEQLSCWMQTNAFTKRLNYPSPVNKR